MRLYAKTLNITHSPTPHLGERSYLQLDVQMGETQKREAIVTLLCSMGEPVAYRLLVSEFPEWFKEPA